MTTQTVDELARENAELRRRLEEYEETIRALRAGEVDAVVVEAESEQVYTLEAADRAYRLLVEQVPCGAATLTTDGTIIHCNRRFAELLNQPLPLLRDKLIQSFVAPDSRPFFETMLRNGRTADTRGDVSLRRTDGTTTSAHLAISALQEGALGLCLMVTDLTEQWQLHELQRTQAALRAVSERLELAQQAGHIGTFEWDIRTGAVSWSATEEELYGLPAGGFGGRYENWKQAVHPDDVERAEAEVLQAINHRKEYDTEFRIVRPDGQTRWIASRGKVFYGPDGVAQRMVGINLDVTERKQALDELREADRRKNQFLATLSHELRNPLAPIRNAIQILKVKGSPQPELKWGRDVIDRQVQVMARLLEDLLDVSRISRNKLDLRLCRVGLAAVVEAALETSRPVIAAGGHELTVSLPSEPVHLNADPVRLAQVLYNLLNNAAKYTEAGGRISLTARRDGDEVIVAVRDSGIGIPAEVLPRIFDIFSQATPALERAQGGLGIGLSLAKGLVELHHGSIEAHSDGPGRGSEFVIRLPVAAGTPAIESASPAEENPLPPLTKCRILIVDDNQDSADSLSMLLQLMGNEVGTAYDGEQAVEAAESMRPDVVLLDIGMPRLNGYDACRRIRQKPWAQQTLMIALTGWGQEDDIRRTREAGFNHHLVKPVDPAALSKLMVNWSSAPRRERDGE